MTGMPEATGLGLIHPDNVFGLVIGVKVQTCGDLDQERLVPLVDA